MTETCGQCSTNTNGRVRFLQWPRLRKCVTLGAGPLHDLGRHRGNRRSTDCRPGPGLGSAAWCEHKLAEHRSYVVQHLEDMPDVGDSVLGDWAETG